jgi:hypothetical protein
MSHIFNLFILKDKFKLEFMMLIIIINDIIFNRQVQTARNH